MIKCLSLLISSLKYIYYSRIIIVNVLIVCFVQLRPEEINAQNNFSTDLTLSSGLFDHKVLDQTISPMIYRGTSAPLFIELNIRGINYYHRLSVTSSRISMKSRITNTDRYNVHLMDNINFHINFSTARRIYSNTRSSHFSGLELSSFLNYRDLTMHTWASGMTTTADNTSSLSVFYNYTLTDEPFFFDLFEVNFSIPFVSYVIFEDTYNADFNESWYRNMDAGKEPNMQVLRHGSFVSLNKFLQLKTNIILTKKISPRFSTKVSYYFNCYSFNKYENLLKVKSLNNAVLVGLSYNFTKHAK